MFAKKDFVGYNGQSGFSFKNGLKVLLSKLVLIA